MHREEYPSPVVRTLPAPATGPRAAMSAVSGISTEPPAARKTHFGEEADREERDGNNGNNGDYGRIQVLLVGPRLLSRSLAATIHNFSGYVFTVQLIEHPEECQQEQREQRERCGSSILTPSVLVLICPDYKRLHSLLNSVFPTEESRKKHRRIVLLLPSESQSLEDQFLLPAWFPESHCVRVGLDASDAELREGIVSAAKGLSSSGSSGFSVNALRPNRSRVSAEPDTTPRNNAVRGTYQRHVPEKVSGSDTGTSTDISLPQTASAPPGSLRFPYRHLSAREEQMARLAAEGLSNSEIAERLGTKVPTVKWHLQNVFSKTEIKRRSQLIVLFAASTLVLAALAFLSPFAPRLPEPSDCCEAVNLLPVERGDKSAGTCRLKSFL